MNQTATTLTKDDVAFLENFIATSKFHFAKTMAHIPHEYVRRREVDSKDFDRFWHLIKAHGVNEKFGKATYRYLYFNGHKYWTMGFPIEQTILINRAVVK